MKKFAVVLFLLFTGSSINNFAFSQAEVEGIVESFFDKYEQSNSDAIDYLFSTNEWMEGNKDGINQIKIQLRNFLELVGEYHGYEKVSEISKGESLTQLTYFVKYDRQPIRFIFVFYNPNNEWRIQNFLFDDKILED